MRKASACDPVGMRVGEGRVACSDALSDMTTSSSIILLVKHLPRLNETSGEIDFSASDPSVLLTIADAAESVTQSAHHGLSGLGELLRCLDTETNQRQAAAILPALGGLMIELSALAACCTELAAQCRHELVDYSPPQPPGEASSA